MKICLIIFQEFGKTPKYLIQRKKGLEYAKEMFEKSKEGQKYIVLSEEEKSDLIEVSTIKYMYM